MRNSPRLVPKPGPQSPIFPLVMCPIAASTPSAGRPRDIRLTFPHRFQLDIVIVGAVVFLFVVGGGERRVALVLNRKESALRTPASCEEHLEAKSGAELGAVALPA